MGGASVCLPGQADARPFAPDTHQIRIPLPPTDYLDEAAFVCKDVRKKGNRMIVKLTSKNQLTLPKSVVSQFPGALYFSVEAEYGRIVLEPVNPQPLSAVREKIAALGISESDVGEAVAWSRKQTCVN